MHIALLCATQRGRAFLEHLFQQLSHCAPQAQLTVFSFVEDPWEPRYLDDIRALAQGCGARFVETRRVEKASADLPSVDLLLAVSWRYLIPANVFQAPRLGAYVFHDSLLPQYRGFAPTVWAILNGESQTGVTLCRMAEHVDAGDIVAQQAVPIGAEETIADVMARVQGIDGVVDARAEQVEGLQYLRIEPDRTRLARYGLTIEDVNVATEALAVGRNWRSANPDQQKQLMTEFRSLLLRTYSGALGSVKDQSIRIKPLRADPADTEVIVRSEVVQPRGEPIQLDYRLEKGSDGWKIYDVNVLGVWLVETYRGQFAQEVAARGIDGLVKSLTDKNKSFDPARKP